MGSSAEESEHIPTDDSVNEESDDSWKPSQEEIAQEQEDNFSRYKVAGKIINEALEKVISECQMGARITDICMNGDSYIKEFCEKTSVGTLKGLAFPTCLSVNTKISSFCPLATDNTALQINDMVKIEMGCHVDGCIALCAHTHKIIDGRVAGEAAHVLRAADIASQITLQLVRPGKKINEVNEEITKVAAAYGCSIVKLKDFGFRKLERNEFGGNHAVPSPSNADTEADGAEFEENQPYTVDIIISSGDGNPKPCDRMSSMVYRKVKDDQHQLDVLERAVFDGISKNFGSIPFSARQMQSCIRQPYPRVLNLVGKFLLEPLQVLEEKQGVHVARVKFTLLVLRGKKPLRITSHALQDVELTDSMETNPEIQACLALLKDKAHPKKARGSENPLLYCGKLALAEKESEIPVIHDMDWNPKPKEWGNVVDILACTGNFGTSLFLRLDDSINLNEGWKKETFSDLPGMLCKWHPDGKILAVAAIGDNGCCDTIYLISYIKTEDKFTCEKFQEMDEGLDIRSMSWSCQTSFLLVTFRESDIVWLVRRVYSQTGRKHIAKVEKKLAFGGECLCQVIGLFSPTDMFFIVSEVNTKVFAYFGSEFRALSTLTFDNFANQWLDYRLCCLAFNRKGDRLISSTPNNLLQVWKVNECLEGRNPTFDLMYQLKDGGLSGIRNVDWRWDGKFFVLSDNFHMIHLFRWNESEGQIEATKVADYSSCLDHGVIPNKVCCLAWHKKKKCILASAESNGFVLLLTSCHATPQREAPFVPEERDFVSEKLYYGPDLSFHLASDLLQDLQSNIVEKATKVVKDVCVYKQQMNVMAQESSDLLRKVYRGAEIDKNEIKACLEKLLLLSSKLAP